MAKRVYYADREVQELKEKVGGLKTDVSKLK